MGRTYRDTHGMIMALTSNMKKWIKALRRVSFMSGFIVFFGMMGFQIMGTYGSLPDAYYTFSSQISTWLAAGFAMMAFLLSMDTIWILVYKEAYTE